MAFSGARAAIVGVGHSKVYRHDDVSLGLLAIDACRQAIEDARLTPRDIDGVCVCPGQPFDGLGTIVDGRNHVSPGYMVNALGLEVSWQDAVGGSTAGVIQYAVNAVSSGTCSAVLAFRPLHSPKGRYGETNPTSAEGLGQFLGPYGVYAPAMFAHLWERYMHKYGTTREQMAPFIVNNRKNALMWEHGYWYQHRPESLTAEDYLAARMISSPLSLFDCDIPVQGCGAFVITSADRARDLPHKPAYVRGIASSGFAGNGIGSFVHPLEPTMEAGFLIAKHLWQSTGVEPADVDVLNVYDGFSVFVPLFLEALGFCPEGEAFSFMTPENIGINGELPLNTSSGNLGAGRMHGVPHMMDAVLQIMGRSGPRQVKDAEISVAAVVGSPTTASGFIFSGFPQ